MQNTRRRSCLNMQCKSRCCLHPRNNNHLCTSPMRIPDRSCNQSHQVLSLPKHIHIAAIHTRRCTLSNRRQSRMQGTHCSVLSPRSIGRSMFARHPGKHPNHSPCRKCRRLQQLCLMRQTLKTLMLRIHNNLDSTPFRTTNLHGRQRLQQGLCI